MPEHTAGDGHPGLVSISEMQTAIEASGYLLEGRVASVLREKDFFVETNIFRPDRDQPSSALEIDVAGRFLEMINDQDRSSVTAAVLVECKNNSQPVAFFVQDLQAPHINSNRINCGGFPSRTLAMSVFRSNLRTADKLGANS